MSWNNFQNRSCEFYPCHKTDPEQFNCWGCYCPLYQYSDCGGNYHLINNVKDCSDCIRPHTNPNEVLSILSRKIYEIM